MLHFKIVLLVLFVAVAVILIFIPPILWPIKWWLGYTWPSDYVDHMGGSWNDLGGSHLFQCYRIVKP